MEILGMPRLRDTPLATLLFKAVDKE